MRRRIVSVVVFVIVTLLSGAGRAASIETLVMPGPVVDAHADIESQCSQCHAVFGESTEDGLCLDCHEPVADDRKSGQGLHGQAAVTGEPCRTCHVEHRGREADITGLNPDVFDHASTGFDLTGGHQALACSGCHKGGAKFREAPNACAGCHEDAHRGQLGEACEDCHVTRAWREARFDHAAKTDFSLTGAHAQATCAACHAGGDYNAAEAACLSCHAPDDKHQGGNGRDCERCHSTGRWADSQFDHGRATGFRLQGSHAGLQCAACHVEAPEARKLPDTCQGCHAADDVHGGRNGSACAECHNQDRWKIAFDHFDRTGYRLEGAHATLACASCHTGALEDPVPKRCGGCHEKDDVHGGAMPECERCHGQRTWRGDNRFRHELTAFPLLGRHRSLGCEQCHLAPGFDDLAGQACGDCHAEQDVHEGAFGSQCAACHNPAGWNFWRFDHDRQTDFALTGAHRGLACAGCHRPGEAEPPGLACAQCHDRDDVHQGRFGRQCERCHSTRTFREPVIQRGGGR
ncbi:MAG: cytochrome C [Pseudomonadales bacterium]|nr:cytochrome C [Pseudomonadales bacterium]